LRKYL